MGATQSRRSTPPINRSVQDVFTELHRDVLYIDTLVFVECVLFCLWMAMVYVPGFALYTIAPSVVMSTGWAHTVSHLGWWNIIEFAVIAVGLRSTKYVLPPPKAGAGATRLRLSLGRAKTWCVAHVVVLILGGLADIVDIVLTGLEFGDAESTCYYSSWGFLLAFLIVLCLQLLFVKLPLLWCVFEYRRHLSAINFTKDEGLSIKELLYDITPGYTSASAAAEARLQTPLLAKATGGKNK